MTSTQTLIDYRLAEYRERERADLPLKPHHDSIDAHILNDPATRRKLEASDPGIISRLQCFRSPRGQIRTRPLFPYHCKSG